MNKKPICPRCSSDIVLFDTYQTRKNYVTSFSCMECYFYSKMKQHKNDNIFWVKKLLYKYMDWLHNKKVGNIK